MLGFVVTKDGDIVFNNKMDFGTELGTADRDCYTKAEYQTKRLVKELLNSGVTGDTITLFVHEYECTITKNFIREEGIVNSYYPELLALYKMSIEIAEEAGDPSLNPYWMRAEAAGYVMYNLDEMYRDSFVNKENKGVLRIFA